MENLRAGNGKYYTRQLFWEESIEMGESERVIAPRFSLYRDKPGLINFGRAYVDSEDPSGYTVSMELFGEYRLWTVLIKTKWFQVAKKLWDEELDARLESRAFAKIKELQENGLPAQQLAAAKYLANKEYRKDHTASKGRPSKEQIEQKTREEAAIEKQLAEDYSRIRLVK